jgi:hypothetical protein
MVAMVDGAMWFPRRSASFVEQPKEFENGPRMSHP